MITKFIVLKKKNHLIINLSEKCKIISLKFILD